MIRGTLTGIIRTMRPKQWIKNGVIFAALVFDRQLGFNNLPAFFRTLAGFIIFCLLSGVVYIINDIADSEADKNHPEKKGRPIASGDLPIRTAVAAAVIILGVIFPISYLLSPGFTLVALAYFVLNLAYSKWLKHIPIIDVFSISLGFILRVLAGASLITVARFSPWLYVVTSIGALLLGFGKRRGEISLLEDDAQSHRKVLDGYNLPLLDQLITIVSATTIVAYSLYTFSAPNLPVNNIMMLTIPFVVYGIFRYIYLLQVENMGGAPEEIFLKDRPIQVAVMLWGFSVLMIFYIF
ncbi:MAG: decaprenyl-phosphate phosphoribosyltransferase [Anaerolineales bacterium]|jgi:4-hydroxybenzoate polyprenyltransferase